MHEPAEAGAGAGDDQTEDQKRATARAYARASAAADPHAGRSGGSPRGPDERPTIVQRIRAAPITAALIAINVAVFLWVQQQLGNGGSQVAFGALSPIHVWAGEYWRVGTYMFLHAGWLHLGVNMYMAAGWASSLERALGTKRFLLLYFLSGIAGGCASVISSWLFGIHLSVGASGALFGVVGAVLALRRRQLGGFGAFVADPGIRSLLLQMGIWTAIGLTALNFDNAAHFGGLVTGFVVTWLFSSRASTRAGWLLVAAAFGALFIFTARPWWTPQGKDANLLLVFAQRDMTGHGLPAGEAPSHAAVARGERLLTKGCSHGIALACGLLAEHLEAISAPDAPARAEALRRRMCDLDPAACQQIR